MAEIRKAQGDGEEREVYRSLLPADFRSPDLHEPASDLAKPPSAAHSNSGKPLTREEARTLVLEPCLKWNILGNKKADVEISMTEIHWPSRKGTTRLFNNC